MRVDGTVQNGHVYRYRLQALADTGPGRPSDSAALAVMANPAVPAAVTGLQATATTTTLQLSWTRAATGGLPVAYRVRWRADGTAADFREAEVDGTSHTLSGLLPGTAYDLRVVAFNQVGDAPAATRTATTVPIPPGPVMALAVTLHVGARDVPLQWPAPATGGRPDGYHVQVKARTASDWPDAFTTVTGTAHTLTGLELATVYDLRLRATNAAGVSDWMTTSFTTAPAPEPPPTALPGQASGWSGANPEDWPEAA